MRFVPLFVWLACGISPLVAQNVAESQRQAVAKFPDLAKEGSDFHKKFLEQYQKAKDSKSPIIQRGDWPLRLAEATAAELLAKANEWKAQLNLGPFPHPLHECSELFQDIWSKGHPKKQDQFETNEEYKARLPKPLESDNVFYVKIDAEAGFSYKIENEELSFRAGVIRNPSYRNYDLGTRTGFMVGKTAKKIREYEASNAYGKTVQAKQVYMYKYYVHLPKEKQLPKQWRVIKEIGGRGEEQLQLGVVMGRDDAKAASEKVAMVAGIRFVAYDKSEMDCTGSGKPTINDPLDWATFDKGADGEVLSLHLINTETKDEIARWTAP